MITITASWNRKAALPNQGFTSLLHQSTLLGGRIAADIREFENSRSSSTTATDRTGNSLLTDNRESFRPNRESISARTGNNREWSGSVVSRPIDRAWPSRTEGADSKGTERSQSKCSAT